MTYENYIRKEFIEGLIYFSKGKISKQEAQLIAEKRCVLPIFQTTAPWRIKALVGSQRELFKQ